MIRFHSSPGDDLKVDESGFDEDGDLNIDVGNRSAFLSREQVTRLRDLLTEYLGDEKDEPTEKESPARSVAAEAVSRSYYSNPSSFFIPEKTLDQKVDELPFAVAARLIERLKEASA